MAFRDDLMAAGSMGCAFLIVLVCFLWLLVLPILGVVFLVLWGRGDV